MGIRGKVHNKRIIQKNSFGEVVKIWDNLEQLIEKTGYLKATIKAACKKEIQLAYNYEWEFDKNDNQTKV